MSMDSTVSAPTTPTKFGSRNVTAPLGPVARYNLNKTLLLTSVPFLCGIVLVLLLTVFAKLNLYYLEANGLIIDDQIRDAYYSQVQMETMNVAGFLVLQLLVTAVVSIVVMRWASAPFSNAVKTLQTAVASPDSLKPTSRWLSESPFFDRVIWLFALRVKSGGENQVKSGGVQYVTNLFFLLKFWVTFAALSVVTGYFMGFVLGSVYERIIGLAFELVKAKSFPSAQHFFAAQQEILRDATNITTVVSLVIYFLIGVGISRYMTTMMFVFTRALEEDRFPIQLRTDDVYHGLANALNSAREKIR
ncbi:MAG: hypothetical protein ACXVB9_15075 [Bdellovibrionota bacterium]